MALSINEEGEEFLEDVVDKENVKSIEEQNRTNAALHHQQSSRPYRLRRQVKM